MPSVTAVSVSVTTVSPLIARPVAASDTRSGWSALISSSLSKASLKVTVTRSRFAVIVCPVRRVDRVDRAVNGYHLRRLGVGILHPIPLVREARRIPEAVAVRDARRRQRLADARPAVDPQILGGLGHHVGQRADFLFVVVVVHEPHRDPHPTRVIAVDQLVDLVLAGPVVDYPLRSSGVHPIPLIAEVRRIKTVRILDFRRSSPSASRRHAPGPAIPRPAADVDTTADNVLSSSSLSKASLKVTVSRSRLS